MAVLTSMQLTSAITANQTTFQVQNVVTPTGAPGLPSVGPFGFGTIQLPLLIDSEVMYLVAQLSPGFLQVRTRGAEGTLAIGHDALSNCYTGYSTDFNTVPASNWTFQDFNQPGTFSIGSTTYTVGALPLGNTTFNINATSAAAITLPAPLLSQNGLVLTFTANTGSAHTISATGLIHDGSGTLRNTATFSGQIGAMVAFIVENGFYNVFGTPIGITFS
jgi:hypothetical protein